MSENGFCLSTSSHSPPSARKMLTIEGIDKYFLRPRKGGGRLKPEVCSSSPPSPKLITLPMPGNCENDFVTLRISHGLKSLLVHVNEAEIV